MKLSKILKVSILPALIIGGASILISVNANKPLIETKADTIQSIGTFVPTTKFAYPQGTMYVQSTLDDSWVPTSTGSTWDYKNYYYTAKSDLVSKYNGVDFTLRGYDGGTLGPGFIKAEAYSEPYYYLNGIKPTSSSYVKGDIMLIGGVFGNDEVTFRVDNTYLYYNGIAWEPMEEVSKKVNPSTKGDIAADDLVSNTLDASCVINFDQTYDALDYRKDDGGTGLFLTSDDISTNSEVKFYLPENTLSSKKGLAIHRLSFDYMILDQNKTLGVPGGDSLTSDGFYQVLQPNDSTSYMLALESTATSGPNKYLFDLNLIGDASIHTFSMDINYPDVSSLSLILNKFMGQLFIRSVKVETLAYNETLNSFVKDDLKMFSKMDFTSDDYLAAKQKYELLSQENKNLFKNDPAYKSAMTRFYGSHVHSSSETLFVPAIEPTCHSVGQKAYYICEICGQPLEKVGDNYVPISFSDLFIPTKEHTYTFVAEVAATEQKEGVKAHYICNECEGLFIKDGDKYISVSMQDLIIPIIHPEQKENSNVVLIAVLSSVGGCLLIGGTVTSIILLKKRKQSKLGGKHD